jgi:acetyl esterase/lipase
MKRVAIALCLFAIGVSAFAKPYEWPPSGEQKQIALWPGDAPDGKPMPAPEKEIRSEPDSDGHVGVAVTNITAPTLTIYSPANGRNTGAAVVVFPGGGFQVLAITLEGTEVCDWLTSKGVTCIVLKYRVPSTPYQWQCDCRPDNLTVSTQALEDAQRAIGLVRLHAKEWQIDPHKIGVLGFSAGGYLVAEISTHFERRLYRPVDEADKLSARPDFAVPIYPGHLVTRDGRLNPNIPVTAKTPPTLLLQAEDDNVDDVTNSLLYYAGLKKTGVSAEMHLYAQGGHAFGLRKKPLPISDWPALVEKWLQTIGMIGQ